MPSERKTWLGFFDEISTIVFSLKSLSSLSGVFNYSLMGVFKDYSFSNKGKIVSISFNSSGHWVKVICSF